MPKKVTYNLNFLAKSIFELDYEYEKIIRILTLHNEHLKGVNQTQITRYFGSSKNHLSRRTIHKKLFGAKRTRGLIPTEYVIPRLEKRSRYKKTETTFHLTFKGLFGALATGIPLKKIYIYKNFLNAIDHFVKDKKINKIIKKYYELQIQSFLLWHYIYGIQLNKVTTFQTYYSEFVSRTFSHTDYFGIHLNPYIITTSNETEEISDKVNDLMYLELPKQKESKEYVGKIIDVFSLYFMYKGIISLMRKNGIISTNVDFLKPDFNDDDTREGIIFDKLINDWPIYFESVYQAKSHDDALFDGNYEIVNQPNVRFLPQGFYDIAENNPKKLEEIEKKSNIIFIPTIADKIKNVLKEMKIQISIPESRPSNVYPF